MPRHHSEMTRLLWEPWRCEQSSLIYMEFMGRKYIRVQRLIKDAVLAMEQALRNTGYEDPTDYCGSYMCRTISGLDVWSEHAYGVAIDLDYGYKEADRLVDKNPHLRRRFYPGDPGFGVECQITEAQVRAVEAIKNTRGEQMWEWLGWKIGDTMHFAIRVRPDRTDVDWDTVVPLPEPEPEEDMAYKEFITQWITTLFALNEELQGDPNYWIDMFLNDPTNPELADFWTAYGNQVRRGV